MTDPTVRWSERLLDGRYRLGDRLGGGAVAEVFRGLDERLQRPVAVKLFRGDAAEQLQRHEAEMRTLAQLDHPSLVTVFDAGSDPDTTQPYLVMQLVEGHTLADELRGGPLPPDRLARYGAALADALAYVHAQGFVHRDVKPANVLVSEDGRVHLADFGIARLVDSAHVTSTGEVLGTPAFFAPEQVAGEVVAPPADVYALGLILIEALTGRRAYPGTAMEAAMARLHRDPELPPDLPPGWSRLLRAMTMRDPAQRPAAEDVAAELRSLSEGDWDRTVTLPPPPAATATTVMPVTQIAAAMPPATPQPAPVATAPGARRGPAVGVVLLVLVLAAAVAAAVVLAVGNSGGNDEFTPGTPTIKRDKVEQDVQQLERLVQQR